MAAGAVDLTVAVLAQQVLAAVVAVPDVVADVVALAGENYLSALALVVVAAGVVALALVVVAVVAVPAVVADVVALAEENCL